MLLTQKDNKTGGDATEVDALMEYEKKNDFKNYKICPGQCCSVVRVSGCTLTGLRFDSQSRAGAWIASSIPNPH